MLLASCGGGGGDDPPPPDTTAPDTTITAAPPAASNSTSVTFSFSSPEAGASFETSLDGAAFGSASSPVQYTALADGTHTFSVRARDAAGNFDASPATSAWTVDTAPPDTRIDSAPPSTGITGTVSNIVVSSPESGITFEGSLDNAAFAAITTPWSIAAGGDGAHTLRVRARDAAGNVDATPASASWTLDMSGPVAQLQFPYPNFATDAASITVRGTASDVSGVASVMVKGISATTTDNFANWTATVPLAGGAETINIAARDQNGHVNTAAASAQVDLVIPGTGRFVVDPGNDRVYMHDKSGNIYVYRISDRSRTHLADLSTVNSIESQNRIAGLVLDAPRNRLLVVDRGAEVLVAVALADGAISVISPSTGPWYLSSTSFDSADGLAMGSGSNTAYVLNPDRGRVIVVDLQTGARTVLVRQNGSNFPQNAESLTYDDFTEPGNPRLLVASGAPDVGYVLALYPATGATRYVSGSNLNVPVGSGPELTPRTLALDRSGGRLISFHRLPGVYEIDLNTGARRLLGGDASAGSNSLFPPWLSIAQAVNGMLYTRLDDRALYRIDLSNLQRTAILSSNVGTGVGITGLASCYIMEQSGVPATVLALTNNGRVVRVDLATGNRTLVSSSTDSVGSGPAFDVPRRIYPDLRPTEREIRALVLGSGVNSVNFRTGERNVIVGSLGPTPGVSIAGFGLDASGNRVIHAQYSSEGLFATDLLTGTLSPVSTASRGSGPAWTFAGDLVLDHPTAPSHAYVMNTRTLLRVNLVTGDREVAVPDPGLPGQPGPMYFDSTGQRLYMLRSNPASLTIEPFGSQATRQLISGRLQNADAPRGTGTLGSQYRSLDVRPEANVAIVTTEEGAIAAIDLLTGDRIFVSL